MRSRPSADDRVADVTRRRLEALTAELAAARGEPRAAAPPPADRAEPAPAAAPPPAAPPAAAGRSGPPRDPAPGRHARRPLSPARRLLGRVADHVPAGLQGRAHLGSAQFGLVALVVAAGLLVGVWWLARGGGLSDAPGEAVPPRISSPAAQSASSTPAVSPSTGQPGPVAPAGAAEGQIVVDVVGRVRRPGIAVLPAGARVVDAVRAAGGVRRGVDLTTVNMARLLTDGEQVVVGVAQPPGSAAGAALGSPGSAPTQTGLVNLNSADQATLETLPGVGPVTAAAIIQWRTDNGGFTSVDELLEVSGIGDATLAEIAPHVTL